MLNWGMGMIPYVALLRGINVSGQKIIKMEQLRGLLGAAGYVNVQTYIQSGNIYFESVNADAYVLETMLEDFLLNAYGFQVSTIIRSVEEMEDVIRRCPFAAPGGKHEQVYVAFLKDRPGAEQAAAFEAMSHDYERFVLDGKEGYCWCRKDMGESVLLKTPLDKKLKTPTTIRNWATTLRLAKW